MIITYKDKVTDPAHPIMHGDSPIAKMFNKRQKDLLVKGKLDKIDYAQVTTVLLEILCDDYDKRHASRKRRVQHKKLEGKV